MKKNMQPDAYSKIWSFVFPPNSADIVRSPDCEKLEQPFFFGGSATMKTAAFEPDACGSVRLFVAGKVHIQFFSASGLKTVVPPIDGKDFSTSCEIFFRRIFTAGEYAKLPPSFRELS